MIKKIKVEEAVGMVLAHDLTRITPGEFKGAAFRKGDVVKKEDIPQLLKIGKRFLYVLELSDDQLHEDDAAKRIAAAISQPGLDFSKPHECKINVIATHAGLLKIDVGVLLQINMMDKIIVATRSGTTARTIARFRPDQPIFAFTADVKSKRELSLSRGIFADVMNGESSSRDSGVQSLVRTARNRGYVQDHDLLIVIAGANILGTSGTNMLEIDTVSNILS